MAVTVAFSPSVLLVDRLALDQALRANRQVCRMRTASSICQVQPKVSEEVGAVAGGWEVLQPEGRAMSKLMGGSTSFVVPTTIGLPSLMTRPTR